MYSKYFAALINHDYRKWIILTFFSECRNLYHLKLFYGDLVGFVALRPKSTAMVIAGRSVHLTTLFPGQA